MIEPVANFSQLAFSLIIFCAIAGVGATLVFLISIFLRELKSGNLW